MEESILEIDFRLQLSQDGCLTKWAVTTFLFAFSMRKAEYVVNNYGTPFLLWRYPVKELTIP